MNNKKLINDRKEVLRQHIAHLFAFGRINHEQLIKDKAYHAKKVFSELLKKGYIDYRGIIEKQFNVEQFINELYTPRPKKQVKRVTQRVAKSIGQKMSKSRIDMKEIIKQNTHRPSYMDRAALDREHCIDVKPIANPLENYSVQELMLEVARRGFSGSVTYSV